MRFLNKHILFLIGFYLIFLSSFSQKQELIQIKGMVVNEKYEPVSFTHILFKNKKYGTISDQNGKFDFFTVTGDTLEFSCVSYKKSKYAIPLITKYKIYHILAVLHPDTIILPEILIFPWKDFKEFTHVFLETKVPDDDIVRAEKNFELLQLQMIVNEDEIPSAPGAAYNLSMNQRYSQLYWKGQTQPMQIFNVFAWQQFFQYLKNGKFKQKKKKKN